MHELAIAEGIVEAVCERIGPAPVRRVVVEVGRLTCVEPQAIQFCFEVCARGTCAEGALLECREVPGVAWCSACSARVEVEGPALLCSCCGNAELELLEGNRLLVTGVELV